MPRLLVSRCLLGEPCRYDGRAKPSLAPTLALIGIRPEDCAAVCPECEGGLATPRTPAEIEPGRSAADILRGAGRVLAADGADVTAAYLAGAAAGAARARAFAADAALLKEKSPACGCRFVHDGRFQGGLRPGRGVLAEALAQAGLPIFSEAELAALAARFSLAQRAGSDAPEDPSGA